MSTLPSVPFATPLPVTGAGDAARHVAQTLAEPAAHSPYEDVRRSGFWRMRFPAEMEARYQADKSPARLLEMRVGLGLFILLNLGIFSADWLMVPDQFRLALGLRLVVLLPLALSGLALIGRLGPVAREALGVLLSTAMAAVGITLSLASRDELAPAYLVALTVILLFNSGVACMRWRPQLYASGLLLAGYAGAVWALPAPPLVIMAAIALVLVSSALYTLVGAWRLEREDRSNWLMRQHEQVLLTALQYESARLAHLSRFDPLTGLANRRHADAFLAQVWGRCQHAGEEVALLMLDIDHFKAYNDRHGHPQGDLCLRQVADALQGLLRKPEDLIARFGGEEFIAILPRSSMAAAAAAAERLREGVLQLGLPHAAAPKWGQVTCSVGVACVRADAPGASPARLLAAADEALYRAKMDGRNRIEVYDEPALPPPLQLDAPPALPPEALSASHKPSLKPSADERRAVAAASDALDRSSWAMRFPTELERQYVDEVGLRLHYFTVSGLLSLIVFNGFLFVDYLMIPDVFDLALLVRLGLFTPLALAIHITFRWRREWLLRHASGAAIESIIMLRSVLTAVCLMYLLSASTDPLSQYYHVGLVVIVVYVNTIQRLRFPYAAAFSAIVLGISVAGAWWLPAFNPRLTWPITLLLAVSVAFTLLPVYAQERDERRRYLLTRRRAHLLEDWADVQRQLQAMSSTDALTGLSNRRHLQDRMQQVWRRAAHDAAPVAAIMIDVDHFKAYNDRYGHPAGDQCLRQVAQVLSACARGPSDIVARVGGEEFIVVLPGTDQAGAQAAAERIRRAVEAAGLPHEASSTARVVTVSVGAACALARPDRAESTLIAQADAALYEAKQAGRNRVRLARG